MQPSPQSPNPPARRISPGLLDAVYDEGVERAAMATITISLPDPLKAFIDAQVAKGSFGSPSEYLQQLVQEARKREAYDDWLEERLLEGLNSPVSEMTAADWQELRDLALRSHGRRDLREPRDSQDCSSTTLCTLAKYRSDSGFLIRRPI